MQAAEHMNRDAVRLTVFVELVISTRLYLQILTLKQVSKINSTKFAVLLQFGGLELIFNLNSQ